MARTFGVANPECILATAGSEAVVRLLPHVLPSVTVAKIVWPTKRETMMTAVMVVIMTALLGLFFFGIDSAFSAIVQQLLGLLS